MRRWASRTLILAVVSYRLGGQDGVSVEAAKWAWAFAQLGFDVTTVAGSGQADTLLPGLAIDAVVPDVAALRSQVEGALAVADLVLVENLCSLPLNPVAGDVVAAALRGRPAVLRHHDLPWQRPRFAHLGPPPTDPQWRQVCINARSRRSSQPGGSRLRCSTTVSTRARRPVTGSRDGQLECG